MPESTREAWITSAASGKSFAEVGGLWGTVNEQVSTAARAGATSTTMIDAAPGDGSDDDLWRLFSERLDQLGVDQPTCIHRNIDDEAAISELSAFDVVHCSGVLYHCPEPLHTLKRLRAITSETLILGTATMPERVETTAGSVTLAPGGARWSRRCRSPSAQSSVSGSWTTGRPWPSVSTTQSRATGP